MAPRRKQRVVEKGECLRGLGEGGEKGHHGGGLAPDQPANEAIPVAPVDDASHAILPRPQHQRERLGQEDAQRTLDHDFRTADFPDCNRDLLDMAASVGRIDRDRQEMAGQTAA